MTETLIDTSAILALLNPKDPHHEQAHDGFAVLEAEEAQLVTTSFVLVETYALLGRRMGLKAVRAFRADLAPLIEVVWVDHELHERGLDALLDRRRRALSLVDVVSFLVIRLRRINRVFAFDRHFEQEGYPRIST